MLGEGRARVVGQYSDKHDRIILYMGTRIILLGKEFADLRRCGLRCTGARDGRLDDGGEV